MLLFFTEIVFNHASQAFVRGDKRLQGVQPLELATYRLLAARLGQNAPVALKIRLGIQQHAVGLVAVTAGAADLLNVAVLKQHAPSY